jgi:hypothetical protein
MLKYKSRPIMDVPPIVRAIPSFGSAPPPIRQFSFDRGGYAEAPTTA